MTPDLLNRTLLALTALVAVVGLVDAVAGGHGDLAAILGVVAVLQLGLWVRLARGRPAVPIRADLVAWLRDRAVTGGEPVGRVADRAVAAHRAALTGHPEAGPAERPGPTEPEPVDRPGR